MDAKIEEIVRLIKNSDKVVVLTGAGISTESGIPDFRSPETGLWEKVDPMEALSTDVLMNRPEKFYKQGFQLLLGMTDAKPNLTHEVLAKMQEDGYISTIVTQNIDNLHQKAGAKNLLEVHGHVRDGYCIKCGKKMPIDRMNEKIKGKEIPPRCDHCNGVVRPSVVMFGDALPPCFDQAWKEVEKCDLLMVMGTSLEVAPVSYLAQICKKLVIINIGKTAYDKKAEVIVNHKASEVLNKIYKELEGRY